MNKSELEMRLKYAEMRTKSEAQLQENARDRKRYWRKVAKEIRVELGMVVEGQTDFSNMPLPRSSTIVHYTACHGGGGGGGANPSSAIAVGAIVIADDFPVEI